MKSTHGNRIRSYNTAFGWSQQRLSRRVWTALCFNPSLEAELGPHSLVFGGISCLEGNEL